MKTLASEIARIKEDYNNRSQAWQSKVNDMMHVILEQEKMLERARKTLGMLSKRQIATWYFPETTAGEPRNKGYYAGWDDAEYAIKQTLAAISPERKHFISALQPMDKNAKHLINCNPIEIFERQGIKFIIKEEKCSESKN